MAIPAILMAIAAGGPERASVQVFFFFFVIHPIRAEGPVSWAGTVGVLTAREETLCRRRRLRWSSMPKVL